MEEICIYITCLNHHCLHEHTSALCTIRAGIKQCLCACRVHLLTQHREQSLPPRRQQANCSWFLLGLGGVVLVTEANDIKQGQNLKHFLLP